MVSKHNCKREEIPYGGYGHAIDRCAEYDKGQFFVSNGEYETQVQFCPFCGERSPNFKYTGKQMAMTEVEGVLLNGEPMVVGKAYELEDGHTLGGLENGWPKLWTE